MTMPPLTTSRLATAIAFAGLLALAVRPSIDTDTFWHLRAGDWMLEAGRLLDFDPFSHTRFHQSWINHSWLAELGMIGVYRLAGYSGLNLATGLVIWLAFLFVHRTETGGSYLRAFAMILAAAASSIYWSARPQIVSLLLAAIFNYLLLAHRDRGRNLLWLLPLLMVAWVNLHGGFAIGFILLGIAVAGAILDYAFARQPEALRRAGWLAAAGLLCMVAVTANPFGPQMLLYPFRTVSIGVLQAHIQEWQSPDFHARESQLFIALWLATFAAVGLARRRINLTDFLTFSVFTALALLAARNVALFAVVAAPILTRHAAPALAELQARWPRMRLNSERSQVPAATQRLNWLLLSVVIVALLLRLTIVMAPQAGRAYIESIAPVGAARFLRATPSQANLFNSYNYGGYLTWDLYPAYRVFVDGRTDLYDDPFLTEYLNAYVAGPGWEQTFARHDIGVVLVEPSAPIARVLLASGNWVIRYSDPKAVVLFRQP